MLVGSCLGALASALIGVRLAPFSWDYTAALLLLDVVANATALGYVRRRQVRSRLRLHGDELWLRTAFGSRRLCRLSSVTAAIEVPVRRTLGCVLLLDAAGRTSVRLGLDRWPKPEIERLLSTVGWSLSMVAPCRNLPSLARAHPGSTWWSARNLVAVTLVLLAALIGYLLVVQSLLGLPPVTGP